MQISWISIILGYVIDADTGEMCKMSKDMQYDSIDGTYYYEDGEWWLENEDHGILRESNKHDTNAKTFPYREPAGDDLPF